MNGRIQNTTKKKYNKKNLIQASTPVSPKGLRNTLTSKSNKKSFEFDKIKHASKTVN